MRPKAGGWGPVDIKIERPHWSRVYDFLLHGKDNFAVDRRLVDDLHRALPSLEVMAFHNRAFMHRATDYLVRQCGIDQFLDIGVGIAMEPNVHQVAQAFNPMASTVYVDNDPIALAHARALLSSPGKDLGAVETVDADLTDPKALLAEPGVQATLDLDRPVGLMLLSVLMLLEDEQNPWRCAAELMDALPSGSHVAISHLGRDFDEPAMGRLQASAAASGLTLVPRDQAEVERFFDGWKFLEPGIVPANVWMPETDEVDRAYYWVGVARKP